MNVIDYKGIRHPVPENVRVARNADRYRGCTSCYATADALFISDATATAIYPEPRGEEVKPIMFGACRRHVRINLKRAADAKSRTGRWDESTQRLVWVEDD